MSLSLSEPRSVGFAGDELKELNPDRFEPTDLYSVAATDGGRYAGWASSEGVPCMPGASVAGVTVLAACGLNIPLNAAISADVRRYDPLEVLAVPTEYAGGGVLCGVVPA